MIIHAENLLFFSACEVNLLQILNRGHFIYSVYSWQQSLITKLKFYRNIWQKLLWLKPAFCLVWTNIISLSLTVHIRGWMSCKHLALAMSSAASCIKAQQELLNFLFNWTRLAVATDCRNTMKKALHPSDYVLKGKYTSQAQTSSLLKS